MKPRPVAEKSPKLTPNSFKIQIMNMVSLRAPLMGKTTKKQIESTKVLTRLSILVEGFGGMAFITLVTSLC